MEGSILSSLPRTQLYFAHPYCSSERGTNENQYGIIRIFITKGSNIGLEARKAVRETQNWMTPLEKLIIEMEDGIIISTFLGVGGRSKQRSRHIYYLYDGPNRWK